MDDDPFIRTNTSNEWEDVDQPISFDDEDSEDDSEGTTSPLALNGGGKLSYFEVTRAISRPAALYICNITRTGHIM